MWVLIKEQMNYEFSQLLFQKSLYTDGVWGSHSCCLSNISVPCLLGICQDCNCPSTLTLCMPKWSDLVKEM